MAQRSSKNVVRTSGERVLAADGTSVIRPQPQADAAEQARLDIERTRAHMGDTLDHIGERLSPERFKAEAVDAVGKIKDEALDTAEHLKEAAVEAAKAATREVIDGVKHATRDAYDQARNRVLDTKNEIEGAGMTVIHTIKRNPIPTAMVGMGLYWLYQSLEENKVRVERGRRLAGPYETFEEREYRLSRGRGYGHSLGAEDFNYRGGRYESEYRRSPGSAVEDLRDRAGEAVDKAKDKIGDVADSISNKASDVKDTLSNKASDLSEAAQERAHALKHAASERFDHYNDLVHEQGHRAVDEFQHMLQSSPLVVAGVAAAIGLAFGMMLPDTQVENRAMGSARDQFVDKAQEKVSDTVAEIKDKATDLKDKAVQVASSAASTVVETVKDEADKQGLSADLGIQSTPKPGPSVGTTQPVATTQGSNPLIIRNF